MRASRIVVVLLIGMLFAASLAAADQTPQKPMWPAILFSALLGFGSGQYYLGESGVLFTVGEAAGLGLCIGGGVYSYAVRYNWNARGGDIAEGIAVGGLVVFVALRIWEFIDVVSYRPRKAEQTSFLTPAIDVRPEGVSFALRWQY
jgi:hypothetical protein